MGALSTVSFLRKGKTETFVLLAAGETWTLNGVKIRRNWAEAVQLVQEQAKSLPVVVTIKDAKFQRDALIHDDGRLEEIAGTKQPVEHSEDADDADNDATAVSAEDEAGRGLSKLLVGSTRKKVAVGAGAVGIVALIVGGILVFTEDGDAHGDQDGDAAEQEPWTLPEDESPLALNGRHLIASTDSRSGLALYDTETGSLLDSWDISTTGGARVMSTPEALAVDAGEGEVVVATAESQRLRDGELNTRGSAPVLHSGNTYTAMNSLGEAEQVPDGAVVFAGDLDGAYLATAPATVTDPEGAEVDLEEPAEGYERTLFIAASPERIVTLWEDSDEEDAPRLVIHDPASGEVLTAEPTEEVDFTPVRGTVLIGEEFYLTEDQELEELCADYEVLTGYLLCPDDDGWTSPVEEISADEELLAVSPDAYIQASDRTVHILTDTED